MAGAWVNDGAPMTDGRYCYVVDPEDGTHPMRVYGRTKDEVTEKLAKTAEHSQRMIASLRSAPPASSTRTIPAAPPAAPARKPLTADETMQLTADLSNPAKAPRAISRLLEDATGVDLNQMRLRENAQRVAGLAQDWESAHPEFPGSPVNRKLMLDSAALRVGVFNITAGTLDEVYAQLAGDGLLLPAYDGRESSPDPTNNPTVHPDETPAERTVRPRGASSYRRTSLRGVAPATTQTRYTRAQVDAMPADELARRYRTEPGFADLVNAFSQPARATA